MASTPMMQFGVVSNKTYRGVRRRFVSYNLVDNSMRLLSSCLVGWACYTWGVRERNPMTALIIFSILSMIGMVVMWGLGQRL